MLSRTRPDTSAPDTGRLNLRGRRPPSPQMRATRSQHDIGRALMPTSKDKARGVKDSTSTSKLKYVESGQTLFYYWNGQQLV